MFTGLIEETGRIVSVEEYGNGGKRFTIGASAILDDCSIDDSIAVNGVCLTVVMHDNNGFSVQAIAETLTKTTLGNLTVGSEVNLERALLPTTRLGGHIVQGHVDGTGQIASVTSLGNSWEIWIDIPAEFAHYIIPVGSICLDGISLTVARCTDTSLMVAIIPHTWDNTTIHNWKVGTQINLEFDIVGKYIERMTAVRQRTT
ncbi:MAG: riboflavin synthase [Candidatus Kapabacteria bacterium]|nr:riboflavin synthase [Candidatus Kapabacteria bacterium]